MTTISSFKHKLIGRLQYIPYWGKKFKEKTIAFASDLRKFNFPMGKRVIYENFCKIVNFPTYIDRKILAWQLIKQNTQNPIPEINPEVGLLPYTPQNFTPLEVALTEARGRLAKVNVTESLKSADGKHRYFMGLYVKDLTLDSPVVKLAFHPHILTTVTKYIGILPVLNSISIVYSPNDTLYDQSSQFLHLDPEGVRQIKIFIYVEDVTEESGPFTIIPKSESKKVYPLYKGGRLTDEFFQKYVDAKYFIPVTASKGTMVFADTSGCFHFGSRPGNKDRFVIILQYISPFSMIYPQFGRIKKSHLGHLVTQDSSKLEKYLLGAV